MGKKIIAGIIISITLILSFLFGMMQYRENSNYELSYNHDYNNFMKNDFQIEKTYSNNYNSFNLNNNRGNNFHNEMMQENSFNHYSNGYRTFGMM